MSTYDTLVRKLKEIFQIDQAELDFGIYRILRSRSQEISAYLETDLQKKVQASLKTAALGDSKALQSELDAAADYSNEVFSHLTTFFGRYYDKGDFVSRRRYKGDTYAVPYDGEEVLLHWANKDQYYIKSGEQFSNFTFSLPDARKVHFKLVTADTSKDNRKDSDKERRFVLATDHKSVQVDDDGEEFETSIPEIVEEHGDLVVHFRYQAMPKGSKQKDLNAGAIAQLKAHPLLQGPWKAVLEPQPTEKNPARTLLEKQLTSYTGKNSADYFIHKDLGGFLRRELDFYIKNEVMNLDDIQNIEAFQNIEHRLRMIQVLREVSLDLITFLGSMENFQKRLWLKKKFVVDTQYCLTLDRIDAKHYPLIAANKAQAEEWVRLGFLTSSDVSLETLQAHPFLLVDTKFFGTAFKYELLSAMDDIDGQTDGVLISSENFQALNLLQERYREKVDSIYVDPPYNTDASAINYKNGYKDSSWNCLVQNRAASSRALLKEDGVFCAAIDDVEVSNLKSVLSQIFEKDIGLATVRSNPQSRKTSGKLSPTHEYVLFFGRSDSSLPGVIGSTAEKQARYPLTDDNGRYAWMNFIRAGTADRRVDRPQMYYPIAVDAQDKAWVPEIEWDEQSQSYKVLEDLSNDVVLVYPNKTEGNVLIEKRWQRGFMRFNSELTEYRIRRVNGAISIDFKTRMDDEAVPTTWWDKGEYASANYGTAELRDLFNRKEFSFPKALTLVSDSLLTAGADESNSLVLDFFAGSGTTGHAVINLNRNDQGTRKYILVEMGEYFNTVLKPRILKVVFSSKWQDGKPQNLTSGISHCFKYFSLESYEDTLNNLQLIRFKAQQDLLDQLPPQAKQDYLFRYMLDFESRHLLNTDRFRKPFDQQLQIAVDSSGAAVPTTIDLVETFNYLIGLKVEKVEADLNRGFVRVEGKTLDGVKTLVFWRDCDLVGYDELPKIAGRHFNPLESEFDVIYLNGDHNIPNMIVTEGGESRVLKLRQIEDEFLTRMFDVQDVQ